MKKLYQQIILLFCFGTVLIGIVTVGVYLVMEGPGIVKSFLSEKEESVVISQEQSVTESSREKRGEIEYIKINVYELADLCDSDQMSLKGNLYVMRGIVYKSRRLINDRQFGLMRLSIWCCVADAAAFGFRISYDKIDRLKDGAWVKVYGRPVKKNIPSAEEQIVSDGIISKDNFLQQWVFEVDHLESTEVPRNPYIFKWRSSEPFIY